MGDTLTLKTTNMKILLYYNRKKIIWLAGNMLKLY